MEEFCGLPLLIERLDDERRQRKLSEAILKDYGDALEEGYARDRAWQSNLGTERCETEPMQHLLKAATSLAGRNTARMDSQSDRALQWSVNPMIVLLPPGRGGVQIRTGGLWTAIYHLRVDPGSMGQITLRDRRGESVSHLFEEWRLGDTKVPEGANIAVAQGLLVLFPSCCAVSFGGWRGNGRRITIVLELTPRA